MHLDKFTNNEFVTFERFVKRFCDQRGAEKTLLKTNYFIALNDDLVSVVALFERPTQDKLKLLKCSVTRFDDICQNFTSIWLFLVAVVSIRQH